MLESLRGVSLGSWAMGGVGGESRLDGAERPTWIPELSESDLPSALHGLGIRAALAFPVTVGNRIASVLEFYAREPRAQDPEFLALTDHLGAQVGRVLERARAERELRGEVGADQNFEDCDDALRDRWWLAAAG